MKVIIDRERLRRRATASHVASLGGLAIILGAVVLSMSRPEWATATAILIFVGFVVSSVGIYFANRWVRKPRPEDTLSLALKGLADPSRIYHYLLPADHVLLMPSGVVVIETVNLEGRFTYDKGRWKQNMTLGRAVRFFVEETLGDPTARARADAQRISQLLDTHLSSDGPAVPVNAVVLFVHPNSEVVADSPPVPVCQPAQLRRRLPTHLPKLPQARFEQVRAALDDAAGVAPTTSYSQRPMR
jgi:hypothetical protein